MEILPLDIKFKKRIVLPSIEAERVVLYEHHPLIGYRYNKLLTSPFIVKDRQLGIVAEPFFFDPNKALLNVEWTIGDNKEEGVFEILLGLDGNNDGETRENIDVNIFNNENIFQNESSFLNISY